MYREEAVSPVVWKLVWKLRPCSFGQRPLEHTELWLVLLEFSVFDLNSILRMCLFALVVGHDTPNQGSIIQNRAGPPAVGEQKPMSCLLSYSENLRPGIMSDAASCPRPHPQRRQGTVTSGQIPTLPLACLWHSLGWVTSILQAQCFHL